MKILIDGDGCPVKDIAIRMGHEYGLEVMLVTSINHYSPNNGQETIYVDTVSQAADIMIANKAEKGDIVVTGDYGLASLCLAKGCFCITFSGMYITNKNIDEMLSIRFINQKIRAEGGRVKGPSRRTCEDDSRFNDNLQEIILRHCSNPQLGL
jgi:uncharacterized protein YaiI (UPF0178 family)